MEEEKQELNVKQDISFKKLFPLLPKIEENSLNSRHRTAKKAVEQIINPKEDENILREKDEVNASVFRWMLESGYDEYGLGDSYFKVMDIICSVLAVVYNEKSILPLMAQMIFERLKRGLFLHELVWAYFQIEDFQSLRLLAEYLQADNEEEALFACKLLHLPNTKKEERALQYTNYLDWIDENEPFFFFTQENLQYTDEPKPIDLDYERKYMHKTSRIYKHDPLTFERNDEQERLATFRSLNQNEKELLSAYSHKVYQQDQRRWQRWIRQPIEHQFRAVEAERGGRG